MQTIEILTNFHCLLQITLTETIIFLFKLKHIKRNYLPFRKEKRLAPKLATVVFLLNNSLSAIKLAIKLISSQLQNYVIIRQTTKKPGNLTRSSTLFASNIEIKIQFSSCKANCQSEVTSFYSVVDVMFRKTTENVNGIKSGIQFTSLLIHVSLDGVASRTRRDSSSPLIFLYIAFYQTNFIVAKN